MHGIELALQMIDALMQACVDQVFIGIVVQVIRNASRAWRKSP